VVEGPVDVSWFDDHYYAAPQQIVDFLAGDRLDIAGKRVADLGTGDGIIALGLHALARPELLVGYDLTPVDERALLEMAREHGVAKELPPGLRFEQSSEHEIPAADGSFDAVVSWSAFEHISDLEGMARELRRVLVPGGIVMIQLFPFYFSEHGDHGWHRPSFEHLVTGVDETPDNAYLNRTTLDELHRALVAGGLRVGKVELIHHAFHLPPELVDHRLTDLAIGGVKLLAAPATE
jgi:ubiquinone/menaquinone biosynthesis C-methylase UbiE